MSKKKYCDNSKIIKYKYPPIYKYSFLLLVIYMLIKHQKIMSQDKLLTNSIIITLIILIIDWIVVENHPSLFEETYSDIKLVGYVENKYKQNDENIHADSDDLDDFDLSIDKEIESLNSQILADQNNKNNQNHTYMKNQIIGPSMSPTPRQNVRQYYSTENMTGLF